MPDSDWSHVGDNDHQGYENAHGAGQPPAPGYVEQESTTTSGDNEAIKFSKTITIWEKITAVPPGQPVSEFCSRCPDHVHTVSGDVTDADQQHVSYLRWGDHRGVKYKNSTIRGTELKREEFVLTIKPKPPGGPGPGLNLGLQWQPNREHRFVFWMSRTIDRVVDGVIWRSFDSRPCTEQGGYYVSLDQAAERLVSAIGLASGREGALPTFVGNEFLGVLTAARRLKNPAFSVSTEQSDWIVALKDADKPDDVVRRVRIGTENGRMKYRGDA